MRTKVSAMSKAFPVRAAGLAALAGLASILLSGCGVNGATGTNGAGSGSTPLAVYQGKVYGGQQPVNGATIQLYSVGTTGVATASTALIASNECPRDRRVFRVPDPCYLGNCAAVG